MTANCPGLSSRGSTCPLPMRLQC